MGIIDQKREEDKFYFLRMPTKILTSSTIIVSYKRQHETKENFFLETKNFLIFPFIIFLTIYVKDWRGKKKRNLILGLVEMD